MVKDSDSDLGNQTTTFSGESGLDTEVATTPASDRWWIAQDDSQESRFESQKWRIHFAFQFLMCCFTKRHGRLQFLEFANDLNRFTSENADCVWTVPTKMTLEAVSLQGC